MTLSKLFLPAVSVLAICAMAVVFSQRLQSVHAAEGLAPGTTQTSGCEEESMFAIWRAVHDRPIYADPGKIPFASAYFNWLFYHGYGAVLEPTIARSGDDLLPRYGRRITASGALFGGLVAALFLAAVAGRTTPGLRWLGAALGLSLFFGPLAGWWALTVRPDIWALAFETTAVAVLLFGHRHRPLAAVCCAAVLFFAAWSCKQTYLVGALSAGAFLLYRRAWRDAIVAALIGLALIAGALLLLGPEYRASLRDAAHAGDLYFQAGLQNLRASCAKFFPVLLGLPLLVRAWLRPGRGREPRSLAQDALVLGSIGAVAGLSVALSAGSKLGAASNYYFTTCLMLTLAVVAAAHFLAARRSAWLIGGGLALLALAPLSGRVGTLDLQPESEKLAQRWVLWQHQPEPRFSSDLRLNLPWLVATSPPLVRAFNYNRDRADGRPFEGGGLGGLIESGYFASLLLHGPAATTYDQGRLDRYRPTAEVAGMVLYLRHDAPEPSVRPARP